MSEQQIDLIVRNAPEGGWTISDHTGIRAAFSSITELCNWLESTHDPNRQENTEPPAMPRVVSSQPTEITSLRERIGLRAKR